MLHRLLPERLGRALVRSDAGAVVIETAIVIPVLVLLSLGGFEVSNIVARQNDLQSAIAEAGHIALAAKPDTVEEVTTVKQVIMASTGLEESQVDLDTRYRCQSSPGFVANLSDCAEGDHAWQYINIEMRDTYEPIWTKFGVGEPLDYNLSRSILVADT